MARASLKPETVALMVQNHIGDLNVQPHEDPGAWHVERRGAVSRHGKKWGLSWLINTED